MDNIPVCFLNKTAKQHAYNNDHHTYLYDKYFNNNTTTHDNSTDNDNSNDSTARAAEHDNSTA